MSDKLILADGTTVELESGASLGNMQVVFSDKESMVEIWDKFTDENLKTVKITNANDNVIAEYTDLVLNSVTSTEQEDDTILTVFSLREKTESELLKQEVESIKTEVYNVVDIESMTLDEYKEHRQTENKASLAIFLKENPILWTDGMYYGVTQEDQNEMNLDLSTYQLKQSIGDTEWKLQWHSVKSVCRDFTMEEFCGLLNTIIEFVYPYRQLEMTYKEAIYSATTKEEVSAVEIVYVLPNEEETVDENVKENVEEITEE